LPSFDGFWRKGQTKIDGLVKSRSAALRFNFFMRSLRGEALRDLTPQFLRALQGRGTLCVPHIGRETPTIETIDSLTFYEFIKIPASGKRES
jgi:hypothetical protein